MSINLALYLSPESERSVFKGLPIELRHTIEVQNLMMSGEFEVRYRGPRRKNLRGTCSYTGSLTCLKEHATSFSIYRK